METSRVGHEEFGPVAAFYDDLMSSVPYPMWIGYYLLLLAKQDVKPRSFLEVCCGTGTLSLLMHKEGKIIEGFDLSEPMIRRAREKAAEAAADIRFEVMDASSFDMGKSYDAAFCFFDSLNYIIDPAKLQLAFHRVAEHLPSGGSWVFDLNTAYAFEQKMFNQKKLSPRAKVRYDWTGDYDPASRLIEVQMKFWVGDREYRETHVQRAHDFWEVREMLGRAGFHQIDVYHSYTLDPPRAKSDRIHIACTKA
jgi:ubiquinone/menaquinone biosynthesis C-methylase UbiE